MPYPVQQAEFLVQLKITAPLLTQAADFSRLGIDVATLFDDNGHPAIPGSLIKGNLRHTLEHFNKQLGWPADDQIQRWFGAESNSAMQPDRAGMIMPEFFSSSDTGKSFEQYRIRIDENTGTATKGAFQVIESRFQPGTVINFNGLIYARANTQEDLRQLELALNKGLRAIGAVGSFKGIGFGKIQSVEVDRLKTPASRVTKTVTKTHTRGVGLLIKPDRAMCFSEHLQGNNQPTLDQDEFSNDKTGLDNEFTSVDFIPGSALLGSLLGMVDTARGIKGDAYPLLHKFRNDIRITHAQPVSADGPMAGATERPHALPLSVVCAKNRFYDIYERTEPGLINNVAPKFSINWKSKQQKLIENWRLPAKPKRGLSIHTEIDASTGASMQTRLFSIESIKPTNMSWLANVDFPTELLDDEAAINQFEAELLELFSAGLWQLGKTSAIAHITLTDRFPTANCRQNLTNISTGDLIRIDLLSDCWLLTDTARLSNATNSDNATLESYKEAWAELSTMSSQSQSLELINYFAAQKLYGGYYIHHRFQKGKAYNPSLLTTAGSVFLLVVKDSGAAEQINLWLQKGLPQRRAVSSRWDENPWISQNGYGEIAVNLHCASAPTLTEWQPITTLVD